MKAIKDELLCVAIVIFILAAFSQGTKINETQRLFDSFPTDFTQDRNKN